MSLELKLGELDIDPDKLEFDSDGQHHKFIVAVRESEPENLYLYVSYDKFHDNIRQQFGLGKSEVVGGGNLYTDKSYLVLGGWSDKYFEPPREVFERYLELLLPEIQKINPDVIKVDPCPGNTGINEYWTKHPHALDG